jgi:hypothetical protein
MGPSFCFLRQEHIILRFFIMLRLEQDHRPSLGLQGGGERQLPTKTISPLEFSDESADVDKIIIRVRMERGIQVFITPLIAPALTQILQDINLNVSSFSPYFISAFF